jgi:hypothetical protein
LENNQRFSRRDPGFGAYAGLLFAAAIFWRSRLSWGFRLLGWRTPLALSVTLLGVGFLQVRRGLRCRTRQSKTAIALLGLATIVVGLLLLFPQVIASVLADISGHP